MKKKKYSKLVKKIADEIVSFNPGMNKLEKEFELIKDNNIALLELNQLQTIIAYEMWKDGMEWSDVYDIWTGKNSSFTDKNIIIKKLQNTFNY